MKDCVSVERSFLDWTVMQVFFRQCLKGIHEDLGVLKKEKGLKALKWCFWRMLRKHGFGLLGSWFGASGLNNRVGDSDWYVMEIGLSYRGLDWGISSWTSTSVLCELFFLCTRIWNSLIWYELSPIMDSCLWNWK